MMLSVIATARPIYAAVVATTCRIQWNLNAIPPFPAQADHTEREDNNKRKAEEYRVRVDEAVVVVWLSFR